MTSSDAEWLFSSANSEVSALFDQFAAYRRQTGRAALKTLGDRARLLRDHGAALEDLGAAIPGLPVLEAMLSPDSPTLGGEMQDQANLVDEGIEDAYAGIGLTGVAPRNPAHPRHSTEHDG
ncbi:MAG: hypothetical protein ABSC16_05215 [Candidatus Dormibacteria bacterium]